MSLHRKLEPVFFFTFSSGEDLVNVEEEEEVLRKLLMGENAINNIDCTFLNLSNYELILSYIENFRETLTIFHFAGHAEQTKIKINDGEFAKEKLCKSLERCKQLKMVFLNGCYTEGFVKELKAINVPMIIATNNAIPDETALDFAKQFYELLIQYNTIEDAFEKTVGFIQNKVPGTFINRKLDLDGINDANHTTISWELFENKNEGIVNATNWTIKESYKVVINNPKIEKEIEKVEKEIEEIEETLEEKTFFYEAKKKSLSKEKLKKLKNKITELQEKLKNHKKKLKKLIYFQSSSSYENAIPKLNYSNQMDEILFTNNSGAYVIKGTKHCGHHVILKRFRTINKIGNEKYKNVNIDFTETTNSISSKDDIWSLINESLFGEQYSSNYKVFIDKITKQDTLRFNHVFIKFENYYDTNGSILKEFWKEYLQDVQQFVKGKITVWLFVMHRNDNDYNFDELDKYDILELPRITPIVEKDIKELIKNHDLPKVEFLELFNEIKVEVKEEYDKTYIVPAVEKMCDNLQIKHIYKRYFMDKSN